MHGFSTIFLVSKMEPSNRTKAECRNLVFSTWSYGFSLAESVRNLVFSYGLMDCLQKRDGHPSNELS